MHANIGATNPRTKRCARAGGSVDGDINTSRSVAEDVTELPFDKPFLARRFLSRSALAHSSGCSKCGSRRQRI